MDYQGLPWERQRDNDGNLEPMMWYYRFQSYYLPKGPDRSLLGAYKDWRADKARSSGKKFDRSQITSTAGAWIDNSKYWQWAERSEMWDQEQLRIAAQEQEDEIRRMFERHVDLGMGMQVAATKRLQMLASNEEDWMAMSPDQARLLAKDGTSLERQARGLPTWLIEIATMTDAELRERWYSMFGEEPPDGDGIETTLWTGSEEDGGDEDGHSSEEPRPPWAR